MKNKQSKGLSLSANPKYLIRGAFFVAGKVFADFYRKISNFYHALKRSVFSVNNTNRSKSFLTFGASQFVENPEHKIRFKYMEIFSWMLGEFASLKSKHDGGVASAKIKLSKTVQYGRSMIEMLGVLAIIGVLSVGGIAGYSKAMEKWKITKMQEEYAFVLQGMLEHLDNLKYLNPTSSAVGLVDFLQASDLVPSTWEKFDNRTMRDSTGNLVVIFSRNNELGFSVNIGGYNMDDKGAINNGFSKQTCLTLFKDLFYPLHSEVYRVWLAHNPAAEFFYGDKFCTADVQCLRNVTLVKMKEACSVCKGEGKCDISLGF